MRVVDEIIELAYLAGASDLHIAVGSPPICRIHGRLLIMGGDGWPERVPVPGELKPVLTAADTEKAANQLMSEEGSRCFKTVGEGDFSYSGAGGCRCRVNVYQEQGRVGIALRLLPGVVPTLAELDLPAVLATFCRKRGGLVLVTGATGSGKSTTLAAMIDLINKESHGHIITLEDPVEYIHQPQNSLITQREVGSDTQSFASALRAALREDPDVIQVGEMRDLETIATALTAAETGHLVLSTLHTPGAAQGVDRVINAFPPHQQDQARQQLAGVLLGITAQTLLPLKDGTGRVVAMEILTATLATRNLIREGKTHQLISQMQTGNRFGMQTMDMALGQIYRRGLVEQEVILSYATDPESVL